MSYKSKILIVDDDPAGRRAMEAPLLVEDYEVMPAQDGPQALELAYTLQPDLILLDVMMPGMDGYEVCRRLRADSLLAEVPIIMVTALDDRGSKLQGLAAGADDILLKPFDRAELRARVQTITRLNRYRSLNAERMQFRWIIDTADEGYVLLDENDRILYRNGPAARLLNLEDTGPAARAGEHFYAIAQRQYYCEPPALWRGWPQVSAQGASPRYLVRPATAQALAIWLSVEVLAVPAGTAAAYLIRLRNVTQQITELRELASFRLAIQHKLRTPIAHMAMSATLLSLSAAPENLPPEAAEYAEIVQSSAAQLGRRIDDLLAFSSPVPMLGLAQNVKLAEVMAAAYRFAGERGLQGFVWSALTAADARSVPLSAQGLELILIELFENACKFHPTNSPQVTVSIQDGSPGYVVLRCEDDGVTLAPTQIEQIWKPFYQVEAGFSGNLPGSGIGLPLIATIVIGAGGRAHFYNRNPGPGVAVELTLPVMPAA